MNQPPTQANYSPPWLLMFGLFLGGAFLVFMAWDSLAAMFRGRGAANADIVILTEANWNAEVVQSKVPVVVDFWAPWCGPCQTLSPTIDRLAARYKGKIKVGKLNIDEASKIKTDYRITSIPRVLVFNGGETPVTSFTGVQSEFAYAEAIDELLSK